MRSLMLRPRFGSDLTDFFDDFFRYPVYHTRKDSGNWPRVNILDAKDDVTLSFEIPGMNKDDIKVSIQDGILTISGERKFSQEKNEDDYYHSEIYSGSFSRSFTIPETINSEKIKADYKDGMLIIKMDKLEEVKPKEIEVKVS